MIAGNRTFPILFCREAAKRGVHVSAACIRGEADRRVCSLAHSCAWITLGRFQEAFDYFKREGIAKVVMAGQISPARLFSREVRESPQIQELLASVSDKRANTIFTEISRRLEARGFEVLSSTTFLEEYVPKQGVLTKRQPTAEEWDNITFALSMAKAVSALDIGLSVAVKSKAVVAVEALEGTDRLIRRAGALAGRGLVVAKVGRPGQDMRIDIPVIGLRTVRVLGGSGVTCLAIESGKTLFLDMKQALALADRKKISIVAI